MPVEHRNFVIRSLLLEQPTLSPEKNITRKYTLTWLETYQFQSFQNLHVWMWDMGNTGMAWLWHFIHFWTIIVLQAIPLHIPKIMETLKHSSWTVFYVQNKKTTHFDASKTNKSITIWVADWNGKTFTRIAWSICSIALFRSWYLAVWGDWLLLNIG